MWPFKSKYDKIENAKRWWTPSCTLEKQEADIEKRLVDRAKKIEELLEKGKKGKSRENDGFFTQKR